MKTKIYLGCFLAASLLAATTSCSGFLDEDPKGKMAPDNYFTCQADLDNSINTIYEKLNHRVGPTLCTHSGRVTI